MLARRLKMIIGLFVFSFFLASGLYAQDTQTDQWQDQNDYDKHTQTLSTQLNLTADQEEEINTILSDYRDNVSGSDINDDAQISAQADADAAIIEVLDENQRVTYQSISADWWSEYNTELNDQTEIQTGHQDMEETETQTDERSETDTETETDDQQY